MLIVITPVGCGQIRCQESWVVLKYFVEGCMVRICDVVIWMVPYGVVSTEDAIDVNGIEERESKGVVFKFGVTV